MAALPLNMKASAKKSPESKSSTLRSITDTVKNDERMKELHKEVMQDLVETVCVWIRRVVIFFPALAGFLLYLQGVPHYVNPLAASAITFCASLVLRDVRMQATVSLCVFNYTLFKSALSDGCSASLIPVVFGFMPGAFGFIYQRPLAVTITMVCMLLATFSLVAIDLSGQCPSLPIAESDISKIIPERMIPMFVMIIGNSAVFYMTVRQAQKAVMLHVNAATSAAKLAEIRRDVLHRVTHELRTPLNGLAGSVELLASSKAMSENDLENARTAHNCLKNIITLCDNVLLVAKSDMTDSASRVKKETHFRLASIVDDVADAFATKAASKSIKLMVNFIGDTTARVRGMEVELRQVLLNLVGNAIKFTHSGSITIRVREESAPSSDLMRCAFEVEDTGIGIDQENAHMLFEAFHQGEEGGAVSRRYKGTGLGLAICRELVEGMGSEIKVDGERGRGSRFYFTLTLKRAPTTSTDEESPGCQSKLPCRIAIVDSEEISSSTCQSVVRSIAQSATTSIVPTLSEFLSLIDNEKQTLPEHRRIMFLRCTSMETEALAAALSSIRKSGWTVIVYCEHDEFPLLADSMVDAYAIFRRPLPIVRIGDVLRGALSGLPSPRRQFILNESTEDKLRRKENDKIDRSSEREKPKIDGISSEGSTQETLATPSSPEADTATQRGTVVVVDDTPVNVRMLVRMVSRVSTMPITACHDGQSAVDLVTESNQEDVLLILMDWHMPEVCGLTATELIRRIARERGGPTVYICMVTADVDGLYVEMNSRHISYGGVVSKGELVLGGGNKEKIAFTETEDGVSAGTRRDRYLSDANPMVDIVSEKPVTLKSVKTILTWFQDKVKSEIPKIVSEK